MFCDYPICISHHLPSKSLTTHPNHWPWVSVWSYIWLLILQVKWTTRCSAQLSAHWEGFPLLFIQRCLRDALGCCSCLLASHAEVSINQALVSSSSVSWSQGTPHKSTGAGWEREGSIKGEGSMGIWTTSCNLPVTCTFRACLRPTAYSPLPFDDEMLTCMPTFMAWWTRCHPTHLG